MPAEWRPQPERSLLALPLRLATQAVVRAPVTVLVGALVLAVASIYLASAHMGFRTSRLDLLNPNSDYNQLWIEYINEFGEEDDAVVVVEGPAREVVVPVLEELSARLVREDQLFHAVLHEVDLTNIRAKGLYYLKLHEVLDIEHFLHEIDPVLQGNWEPLNLNRMLAGLNYRLSLPVNSPEHQAARREAIQLAASLAPAMENSGAYASPWQPMNDRVATLSDVDSSYILTNEGRLGFVFLRLRKGDNQFAQGTQAIAQLRRLILRVQEDYPDARIGLTGLPVMENDEMQASQGDMTRASVLSLFGVACLFIAGFGGFRHPMLAVMTLLLAMAWSFGFLTLAVGHLNILSVSFGVILIGLGIDFGIHYVARYIQERQHQGDSDKALVATAQGVGPGIFTGGITTAIAFFTAGMAEFTGIAELGIIAGGGILLCVAAMLIVLPAAIHQFDRRRPGEVLSQPLRVEAWVWPAIQFPRTATVLGVLLTFVLAGWAMKLRYDHNLLNLQPVGLESVELERKLLNETDQSVWYALSMAETREELLRRKAAFLKLPSVDRTEEIVSLLPKHQQELRPIITRIRDRLDDLPERPPLIPVSPAEVLGSELAKTQQLLSGPDPRERTARRQFAVVRDRLRRMPIHECNRYLSHYQQQAAGDLLSRLHVLASMSDPEPPHLDDLPESLVSRFVGKSNRHLLKIYGKGNLWDMESLEQFVVDVKRIDPKATGQPLQTYFASRHMQRSYVEAAIFALLAVAIVLMIDFRSITCTLLALVPLGLGVLQMFGLMGMLDIPLNPANMIVLPLILGIGIDDGVHVVHDFRNQTGRYRLSSSTATAVLITSLTTTVGFGSLMSASHQGLQSLGRVLTIGVSCCLFSSLVLLPAVLAWMTMGQTQDEQEDSLAGEGDSEEPHEAAPESLAVDSVETRAA